MRALDTFFTTATDATSLPTATSIHHFKYIRLSAMKLLLFIYHTKFDH